VPPWGAKNYHRVGLPLRLRGALAGEKKAEIGRLSKVQLLLGLKKKKGEVP